MQREVWFYSPMYRFNFQRILHFSVLSILYLPIATNSNNNDDRMTENACEWHNLSISCHGGTIIRIFEAFYGRLDNDTCVEDEKVSRTGWDTNCSSPKATNVMKENCNNQENCTLNPKNERTFYNSLFGGDPCSGTTKYLSVNYTCLPVSSDCHCDGDNTTTRNVLWPRTFCGDKTSQECPNNKLRHKAFRYCTKGQSKGEWMHPNLVGCITEEIENMRNEADNLVKRNFSVDSTKAMMLRVKHVSEYNDLYGGDLYDLTRIMVDLVKFSSENVKMLNYSEADNLTEMVLNSTGNLLSNVYKETWMELLPANRSQTAARLLDALETSCTVLAKAADSPKSIKKSAAGIELQINVFNITQMQSNTSTVSFKTPDVEVDIELDDVKTRSYNGLGRTVFILYDDIAKWLYVNQSTTSENNTSSKIISKVVSVSIVSDDAHSAKSFCIRYTVRHQMKQLNSTTASCVFWKFPENGVGGHWSEEGLKVTSTNDDNTTCKSSHLTNFAILMSAVKIDIDHGFALQVITYIGCTISIVCLALALCTFCFFRNLQSDRNTIHKNLVLCLLVAELIFVFGITQYDKKLLCAFVAGFLHYFLLASFAWMCLEGVQLYVLLVEVFESGKSRVKWYYLGGYGIPALIVSISILVNIYMKVNLKKFKNCEFESVFQNEYGAYGTNDYCWLSLEMNFVWAFIGPALAIIAMNSVMLGVAINTMCKHASKTASWKLKDKSKIYAMGSWLRGAAILVVLLGTTWSFCLGMLYESGHTVPMAYIFTVLNSFQGFFIFVFHCLANDKVQTEYQRAIQRSTWLPENVKVKFGGASETPSQSVTERKPLFQRMFARNKRKDSSSSISLPKTDSAAFDLRNQNQSEVSHPEDGSLIHDNTATESACPAESSGFESQDSSYPLKITERHEASYVCSPERPKIRIQRNGAVQKLESNTE